MTKALAVLTLLLLTSFSGARAQNYQESFAARFQGGLNFAFYNADFSSTGDVLDCGQLTSGSGINATFNGILEFPLSKKFGLGVGIGWSGRSGSLTRDNVYPTRDSITGVEGTLTSELELNTVLTYLEIQPDIRFALIDDYQDRKLGLVFGPRIALPLSTEFVQKESIVSPAGATFIVDGERRQTRHLNSGPFTTRSSVMIGLSAGIESLISVGEHVQLVPQVSFDYFFSNILTDASWQTYGVRAELGIRISSGKEDEIRIEQAPPPPVIFAPLQIALAFPRFSGEVVTGDQLRATLPIVNAVFFDSASATVPSSYRRSMDASKISSDPVEAHAWVLPRIAKIMMNNSDATIVLEGATSGADSEPEGLSLAKSRAQHVKEVLVGMGINASRIKEAEARITPTVASNPEFARGREENRRVDIIVRDAPLQQWVNSEQFAQLRGTMLVSTARMGGEPSMHKNSSTRISMMNVDTVSNGQFIEVDVPVFRSLEIDQDTVILTTSVSSSGAATMRDTTINVASLPRRQIDLQTDGFEAILRFDYNSSKLSPDVKDLLRQLTDKLPEGFSISILGSADVLGSAERNRELSEQRASNTRTFIKSISGDKFKIVAGSNSDQFSDATPQGRFLNRSIRITAKKLD